MQRAVAVHGIVDCEWIEASTEVHTARCEYVGPTFPTGEGTSGYGSRAAGLELLLLLCLLGGAFENCTRLYSRPNIAPVHKALFNQKLLDELSLYPNLARWEPAGISYVEGSIGFHFAIVKPRGLLSAVCILLVASRRCVRMQY